MKTPWQNPDRRGQDWADGPMTNDDREQVYPDGTPKYECWNSGILKPAKIKSTPQCTNHEEDEP